MYYVCVVFHWNCILCLLYCASFTIWFTYRVPYICLTDSVCDGDELTSQVRKPRVLLFICQLVIVKWLIETTKPTWSAWTILVRIWIATGTKRSNYHQWQESPIHPIRWSRNLSRIPYPKEVVGVVSWTSFCQLLDWLSDWAMFGVSHTFATRMVVAPFLYRTSWH